MMDDTLNDELADLFDDVSNLRDALQAMNLPTATEDAALVKLDEFRRLLSGGKSGERAVMLANRDNLARQLEAQGGRGVELAERIDELDAWLAEHDTANTPGGEDR